MKPRPKLLIIVISLLVLLIPPTAVSAEDSTSKWRFTRTIAVREEAEYRSVFLDENVYAHAQDGLEDLRILDEQGQAVPFYMDSGFAELEEDKIVYSSNVTTNIVVDHDTVTDYKVVPLMENKDVQVNVLIVGIPQQPFLKHVEVLGSYDGKQWESVKKDYLYRTDQLHKDKITLDAVYKFTYYRLKALDNIEKLSFPSLQLLQDEKEVNWQQYSRSITPEFTIENNDQITTLMIENDNKLKVKTISFRAEGNYVREYTLNDDKGISIPVMGEREFYNLKFEEVQLTSTAVELMKPMVWSPLIIKIDNGDNQPLDIQDLTMEYTVDKLVFEDNGSQSYQLVYGNPNATKPTYDIEQFKHLIVEESIKLGELGQELANQGAAGYAETDSSALPVKYIFNAVIIGVSLLLIILLARKLGKKST